MECDISDATQEADVSEEDGGSVTSSASSDSSSNSYGSLDGLQELHSQIRDMFLEDPPYKIYGDVYDSDDEGEQDPDATQHEEWLLKLGELPMTQDQGERPTSRVFGTFDRKSVFYRASAGGKTKLSSEQIARLISIMLHYQEVRADVRFLRLIASIQRHGVSHEEQLDMIESAQRNIGERCVAENSLDVLQCLYQVSLLIHLYWRVLRPRSQFVMH